MVWPGQKNPPSSVDWPWALCWPFEPIYSLRSQHEVERLLAFAESGDLLARLRLALFTRTGISMEAEAERVMQADPPQDGQTCFAYAMFVHMQSYDRHRDYILSMLERAGDLGFPRGYVAAALMQPTRPLRLVRLTELLPEPEAAFALSRLNHDVTAVMATTDIEPRMRVWMAAGEALRHHGADPVQVCDAFFYAGQLDAPIAAYMAMIAMPSLEQSVEELLYWLIEVEQPTCQQFMLEALIRKLHALNRDVHLYLNLLDDLNKCPVARELGLAPLKDWCAAESAFNRRINGVLQISVN